MMAADDRRILDEFATRVRRRFPKARIWAFGSRIHGDAEWDADMDVCVVLDQMKGELDRRIRAIAWEVGFENERVITTVVLDKDQFENGPMSESTLVANILREGVAA
jgi:predicted nucleotidyltransferase